MWLFQDSALELYNAGVNHQEIILLLENVTDGHSVDASQAFQSMYQYVVNLSTTRYRDVAVISFVNETAQSLTYNCECLHSQVVIFICSRHMYNPAETWYYLRDQIC